MKQQCHLVPGSIQQAACNIQVESQASPVLHTACVGEAESLLERILKSVNNIMIATLCGRFVSSFEMVINDKNWSWARHIMLKIVNKYTPELINRQSRNCRSEGRQLV